MAGAPLGRQSGEVSTRHQCQADQRSHSSSPPETSGGDRAGSRTTAHRSGGACAASSTSSDRHVRRVESSGSVRALCPGAPRVTGNRHPTTAGRALEGVWPAPKHQGRPSGGPPLCGFGFLSLRIPRALLDVARWRPAPHRLLSLKGVLDLAIQIEIVLCWLRRRRRWRWLISRDVHMAVIFEAGTSRD